MVFIGDDHYTDERYEWEDDRKETSLRCFGSTQGREKEPPSGSYILLSIFLSLSELYDLYCYTFLMFSFVSFRPSSLIWERMGQWLQFQCLGSIITQQEGQWQDHHIIKCTEARTVKVWCRHSLWDMATNFSSCLVRGLARLTLWCLTLFIGKTSMVPGPGSDVALLTCSSSTSSNNRCVMFNLIHIYGYLKVLS